MRFKLLLPVVGLACLCDCVAVQAQTLIIARAIENAIASDLDKRTREERTFYIANEIDIEDARDGDVEFADRRLPDTISQIMNGRQKARLDSRDTYRRVSEPTKADIVIHGLRLFRDRDGKLTASARYEFRELGQVVAAHDIPIETPNALPVSLTESVVHFPVDSFQRGDDFPANTAHATDGGFGVQVLHRGERVAAERSEKLDLFVVSELGDEDSFELKLLNAYPFDAVAFVHLDGQPHFVAKSSPSDSEDDQDSLLEYPEAIPMLIRAGGTTVVRGWQNDSAEGQEFKLKSIDDDVPVQGDHNIAVTFYFAAMDAEAKNALPKIAAKQRGFKIGRGQTIETNIETVQTYVQPIMRETVRIVFQ